MTVWLWPWIGRVRGVGGVGLQSAGEGRAKHSSSQKNAQLLANSSEELFLQEQESTAGNKPELSRT